MKFFDMCGNELISVSKEKFVKNFIIDPDFKIPHEDIHAMLDLDEYDIAILTDAQDLETLAAFSGIFPSKSESRRTNLFGGIPHGLHLFGANRTFWVWNPGLDTGKISHSKRVLRDKDWEGFLFTCWGRLRNFPKCSKT